MRIGLLSDTHGNLPYMHAAAERLAGSLNAEHLVHLGDDYEDGEELTAWGLPVLRVPGLYCAAYHDEDIPRVLYLEAEGRSIACVHRAEDLTPAQISRADVVASGHTHSYEFQGSPPPVRVNPGHLKAPTHRGRPPSFALLQVTGQAVQFTVYGLGGEVLLERKKDKGQRTNG